jgi:hypothetical protein
MSPTRSILDDPEPHKYCEGKAVSFTLSEGGWLTTYSRLERRLFEALADGTERTTTDMIKLVGLTSRYARSHIRQLLEALARKLKAGRLKVLREL